MQTHSRPHPHRQATLVDRALGLPLAAKILVAHGAALAVLVMAAGAGMGLVLLGTGLLLAEGAVLHAALSPLRKLAATAARLQEGELAVRAAVSPLADRDLRHVVGLLNDALDQAARHRARARQLASRTIRGVDEERRRVAHRLRDDLAQRVASLMLSLSTYRRREGADDEADLAGVIRALGSVSEDLRTLAADLRPPCLDMLGLEAALEAYAREASAATGVAVRFRPAGTRASLSQDAQLAALRVVAEAVENACEHGAPTSIVVAVHARNGGAEVAVQDDGTGFDVEGEFRRGGGLGIFAMMEEAGQVGGRLDILSTPGRGTRVTARFPTSRSAHE